VAATTAPSQTATFPTSAFGGISLEPLPDEVSAKLDQVLAGIAGGGGQAATVKTADGTLSGAASKADGVNEVESQFGIVSVTKSLTAAKDRAVSR
jgi:CubicO group peptidase (beta-lactamase class C family)